MIKNKFSAIRYQDKSQQLSLTFDLLRHSLKVLSDSGFRRFMENMRLPEKATLDKMLKNMKQIETGLIPDEVISRHRKKMSQNFPITPTLKWAEYKGTALLLLNSNELIVRVALFETFLKEIHRQTLVAKPQLLSLCKPNRPVKLKDIFQGGVERFKLTEIDRQVRETDRLRTDEKARFFRKYLKLPWHKIFDAERDVLKRIKELTNLRHKLVHADTDATVTDNDVKDARTLFSEVPKSCVQEAAKIYPTHFH